VYALNFNPPDETLQVIELYTILGGKPNDTESTIRYLLSLQYEDGTFLINAEEGVTERENSVIRRITLGTYSVVNSLLILGHREYIPDITVHTLVTEIERILASHDSYQELMNDDPWRLLGAIELLAKIDSTLVSERAREFFVYMSKEVVNLPPDMYVFPSRANRLLDIAGLLTLPEKERKELIAEIKEYYTDNVIQLQNISGGFGPEETVEPMTTRENVILMNRLGLSYPNFEKLMNEINNHRVEKGWVTFFLPKLDSDNYKYTYYAIEIAKFSGFSQYNKEKVKAFLQESFNEESDIAKEGVNFEELYYIVKTLNALDGNLSKEDKVHAQELYSELTRGLSDTNISLAGNQLSYLLQINKEFDFELPQENREVVHNLTKKNKEQMTAKERITCPQHVYTIWVSTEDTDEVITRDEVFSYLNSFYDEDSGGYTSLALTEASISAQENITYQSHPDVYQTYLALCLLSKLDTQLPDENKTRDFVLGCKQEYGFGRAPDWPDIPDLQDSYAALMILKQMSYE
jgi:hypothetical protein